MGGPRYRGSFINSSDLGGIIRNANKDTPKELYRSVYVYDDLAVSFAESHNSSIARYSGPRAIDKIFIDIDKGNNTDNYVLNQAQALAFFLIDEAELMDENFRIYFSGSGYHFALDGGLFNFEPSPQLPFLVKNTMSKLFKDVANIDTMIYMATGLYRVPHTINSKTQLYKVPLTRNELMGLNPEDIHELAKTPRYDFPYTKMCGEGELESHIYTAEKPEIYEFGQAVEPKKVATCIQTLYAEGAQEGSRHHKLLRLISHFKRHGIPSQATKSSMLHWNAGSLKDREVIFQVEDIYKRNLRYGCQDTILKSVCSPKCIYYKNKDYSIDVKNASDMQKSLRERMTTDFTGKAIDFAAMLGLDTDCTFYPGELVTIFGPTGSNKTTLAQNIALGYDFVNDKIDRNRQVPTLYLSLELADWVMHRRNLQIITGKTKEEINESYDEEFEKHHDLLSHLAIQTITPTLESITKKVEELQPALVIVDYIDLVETPFNVRGEYEQIKFISHSLSSLAVNSDIVIIQVSQVSRDYSRNQVLDLYAGKGSGAIENASRKVIGVNGQAGSFDKTVHCFKNTDGDLFETKLTFDTSFRLRKGGANESFGNISRID